MRCVAAAFALLAWVPVAQAAPVQIVVLETGPAAETLSAGATAAGSTVARLPAGVSTWQQGAPMAARLVFDTSAVALLGPFDGAGAHVAAMLATKRRVPLIALSSEATFTRVFDPWIFRGVPDDEAQADALLRWVFPGADGPRHHAARVVVPDGREGRERADALTRACGRLGVSVSADAAAPVDTTLLWLDAPEATAYMAEPRASGAPILGSLRLDDPAFLAHGDGVAMPLLGGGGAAAGETHPLAWRLGHDLARAAVESARRDGPDPEKLRVRLSSGAALGSDGPDGAGVFHFDTHGNRVGAIPVGVVRGGRLVPAR